MAAAPTIQQWDDLMPRRDVEMGGFTALAESAWMGVPLAGDVVEQLRAGQPRRTMAGPRLAWPGLRALLTRELSIAEAAVVMMAAFFLSAALGAVRQVLFN